MFLHRTVVSGLFFDGCCEVNNFKGTLCFVCQQKAVGESHKAVKSFFLSESLKIIPNIPFNTPKGVFLFADKNRQEQTRTDKNRQEAFFL